MHKQPETLDRIGFVCAPSRRNLPRRLNWTCLPYALSNNQTIAGFRDQSINFKKYTFIQQIICYLIFPLTFFSQILIIFDFIFNMPQRVSCSGYLFKVLQILRKMYGSKTTYLSRYKVAINYFSNFYVAYGYPQSSQCNATFQGCSAETSLESVCCKKKQKKSS